MRASIRAALLLALLALEGCEVTLYHREWSTGAPFDECEHDRATCWPDDEEEEEG